MVEKKFVMFVDRNLTSGGTLYGTEKPKYTYRTAHNLYCI
jgi:hypothetical protein